MSIRAVIWDLGGVLLRTEDRAPRRAAAARLGLTYEQLDDLVFNGDLGTQAQLGTITDQELWEGVGRALNLPAAELPGLREAFFGGDRLDEELVNFVRSLRPRYKTGLISNAWNDLREFMTRRLQIVDAFDHMVISGEVGIMKPDARIFQLSLDGLGVKAQEAVFIDDSEVNVQGARLVGMRAIRFHDRLQVLADLKNLYGG